MRRSGYGECDDVSSYTEGMWEQVVRRTLSGKRGEAFLRELLATLDAMPIKELIAEDFERQGQVCTLGAAFRARGLAMLDASQYETFEISRQASSLLGISNAMAAHIMYMNDEDVEPSRETSAQRWSRIRAWVAGQIIEQEST